MSLTYTQKKCVDLLSRGFSNSEAAGELNVSIRSIQRWLHNSEFLTELENVREGLTPEQIEATSPKEVEIKPVFVPQSWANRDALRHREVTLLNELEDKLQEKLNEEFSLRIVDRLLKLYERRARLLGLDIRNYGILNSLEELAVEGILSQRHAQIIYESVSEIQEKLKSFD